jgi:uncharacterized protein (DUF302 family)
MDAVGEQGPTSSASEGRFLSEPGKAKELDWFGGMVAYWLRSRGRGIEIQRAAREAFIHERRGDKESVANLSTPVNRATAVRETCNLREKNLMPAPGVSRIKSKHSVANTAARLADLLNSKGVKIFARIDQRSEAEQVGLALRPTELIIFGDPKSGTPLMDAYPSLALDLPLKALIYEDSPSEVWLCFNSPEYLAERHGLPTVPFGAVVKLLEAAAG